MKNEFDIKILRQHWVNDDEKDDKFDLCSHGEVYLRIGTKEILNKESGSWTLSSTALYLMRTIFRDYKIGDYSSQLIPCCGHFFIPSSDGTSVAILGCPNGIDWNIEHLNDLQIKHILENEEEGIIDKTIYKSIVMKFVEEVEEFYNSSQTKELPDNEDELNGYLAFWNEWNSLKNRILV